MASALGAEAIDHYIIILRTEIRPLSLPCDWVRFIAELSVYTYTCLIYMMLPVVASTDVKINKK
jgi:hypothetical protein